MTITTFARFFSVFAFSVALLTGAPASADVTLSSDFTDPDARAGIVYEFWNTHNRLPPYEHINVPALGVEGASVNTVRMIGGWSKGGERMLDYDPCRWDGEKYIYDWEPLFKRIDVVLASGIRFKQMVLDNPPWAFQQGMTFVKERDGIHFLEEDKTATYGNAAPPNDAAAWNAFIQEALRQLVERYSYDQVASWRFRIGSEIDTRPGHWLGTRQEFFDHYLNTVNAVHAVIPEAEVGTQFREADFTGEKYIDYKGNVEGSYAVAFLRWCKENNVPYDFLGVSYYPFYDQEDSVDMDLVYAAKFAPIQSDPAWNPDAKFEIHEFSALSQFERGIFSWLTDSYSAALFASISKMVLENDIRQIHLWGNVYKGLVEPNVLTQKALETMKGKDRYTNVALGEPAVEGNMIDGIFASDTENRIYQALVFNYNKKSVEYQEDENVSVLFHVATPSEVRHQHRIATYGKEQCAFQQIKADFPELMTPVSEGGLVKDGFDLHGSFNVILTPEGVELLEKHIHKYVDANELQWSSWEDTTAESCHDGENSLLRVQTQLPSFAFQIIEVRRVD